MQGTQERDFTEFMRANGTRLFRAAYLLTGNRHRAEDLTQDALARAYAAWSRVRADDAFGYTRRILVNLHNDWWRGGLWRERSVDTAPSYADGRDHAGEVVRRDWVVRSLRELTRRERSIVVLRYFADLPEAQVAEELNVSLGTVKSTTSRALDKLREAMSEETSTVDTEITVESVRRKVRRRRAALTAAVATLIGLVTIGIAWPLQAGPKLPPLAPPLATASPTPGINPTPSPGGPTPPEPPSPIVGVVKSALASSRLCSGGPVCRLIEIEVYNFGSKAKLTCQINSAHGSLGTTRGSVDAAGHGYWETKSYYGYPDGWVSITCDGVTGRLDPWGN